MERDTLHPSLTNGRPREAVTSRLKTISIPAERGRDAGSFDAIDDYVERERRRLMMPGVSLAIVEGDQIVHTRGFGRALPDGRPPAPETPFYIGSITKSFTALAIVQLVEAGKIALDAPVQQYLPWFSVKDCDASLRISVRHLLNQTSGLPDLIGEVVIADFDPDPGAAERHARSLATAELAHPVGSAWEYCNSNYILLGLIIEAVTGEPYTSYLQDHILDPLGMRDTHAPAGMGEQNEVAEGHQFWFGWPLRSDSRPLPAGSLAGGGLISTAADLGRYVIALLNGGRLGDAQILSSEGIAMLQCQAIETQQMNITFGYGMGWFVNQLGPGELVWHSGSVPHYCAYVGFVPNQRKGLVLLFNAGHHWMSPVLGESGGGAVALLVGGTPEPILPIRVMPWALRAQLLIPAMQLAGMATTIMRVRRWRRQPDRRPGDGRAWVRHLLLPLAPALVLGRVLVAMLGRRRAYLGRFMPDSLWLAILCSSFALAWSMTRTILCIAAMRGAPPPLSK